MARPLHAVTTYKNSLAQPRSGPAPMGINSPIHPSNRNRRKLTVTPSTTTSRRASSTTRLEPFARRPPRPSLVDPSPAQPRRIRYLEHPWKIMGNYFIQHSTSEDAKERRFRPRSVPTISTQFSTNAKNFTFSQRQHRKVPRSRKASTPMGDGLINRRP